MRGFLGASAAVLTLKGKVFRVGFFLRYVIARGVSFGQTCGLSLSLLLPQLAVPRLSHFEPADSLHRLRRLWL